jgi:uncharacterized protein with PIN domain
MGACTITSTRPIAAHPSAAEIIRAVDGLRLRFRFHGELNDFLPPPKRNTEFEHPVGPTDTLKHVIEALGVPHPEVGAVIADGMRQDVSTPAADFVEIQVFPHQTPLCLSNPKFVVDGHLGRLAAYLRMLGLDTWYERLADDPLLASVSSGEQRLLLTRDVGLLKRREVLYGYCVRSDKPHEQLREVSTRFALSSHFAPFTRCMDCNGLLAPVQKSEVAEFLPPHTRETKNEFSRCLNCGKIFWRGSHHARMLGWIQNLSTTSRS